MDWADRFYTEYTKLFVAICALESLKDYDDDIEEAIKPLKQKLADMFKDKNQVPGKLHKRLGGLSYYPNGLCDSSYGNTILSSWTSEPIKAKGVKVNPKDRTLKNVMSSFSKSCSPWYIQYQLYKGKQPKPKKRLSSPLGEIIKAAEEFNKLPDNIGRDYITRLYEKFAKAVVPFGGDYYTSHMRINSDHLSIENREYIRTKHIYATRYHPGHDLEIRDGSYFGFIDEKDISDIDKYFNILLKSDDYWFHWSQLREILNKRAAERDTILIAVSRGAYTSQQEGMKILRDIYKDCLAVKNSNARQVLISYGIMTKEDYKDSSSQ